jgi:hypothetical protein
MVYPLPMILFLDFDGVLHPVGGKTEPFCHVPMLWRVLRACPSLRVVFSTSWRETYTMDYLVDFATSNGGEDLVDRFIGITPVLPSGDAITRLRECEAWLDENGFADTFWLAVDDDQAEFGSCPQLILTDRHLAIQDHHVDEMIRRFQGALMKTGATLRGEVSR